MPIELPYVQAGIAAVLLLSVVSGLLGSFIVLRGLAFFVHAVGTATFPGLVLAEGLGFAAALGGFGAALAFVVASAAVGRSHRTGADSVTALVLVGCLAAGVILASDIFASGPNVETLLFGSLLLIDTGDLWLAGGAAGLALATAAFAGPRWLARGFDPATATALGAGTAWLEGLLLAAVALAATAALTTVGALLVTAILVVPAATVRLLTSSLPALQLGATALAAVEGILGIWLAIETDAPPGAAIAVLSGLVFAGVAVSRSLGARQAALAAVVLGGLALAGCGPVAVGRDRLGVVATTPEVADLVRNVAGPGVDVEQVVEPGTDPHEYEPRPSDVSATAEAEIIFRSGGDIDDWTGTLVDGSGSEAIVVSLDRNLRVPLDGHGHDQGETDPHWWHDPRNAAAAVAEIEGALAAAEPRTGPELRRRAAAYLGRIRRVDRDVARCVARIPAASRELVAQHGALGYYANRYGLQVAGSLSPALNEEAQPSAGELADLADLIERDGIEAVFPESGVPHDLVDAVAADGGAEVGEELHTDTLAPEDDPAGTYLGMEAENTDAIVRGLTGGRLRCRLAEDAR
ncbi:MAG TPA: zinc ABC transporter substrate-binding protein [Solirubrobacterales bacterium]|nr:zinc ABC transporter substrate-binding protein [Solirubrobacterales bacterium]